jgi:UDP-2,3-diacylglucosamine pyrophosphatase LpxH
MKTVVIGDIHGRDCWKQIVIDEQPDRVIFIGDYFDSYDDYTAAEQMWNFEQIINFKLIRESVQSEVIILVGNHDFHYVDGSEHYSGYQFGAAPGINDLLFNNMKHMQMAYEMDGYLFTHAGVSNDWYTYWMKMLHLEGDNVADNINEMWKASSRPFRFAGFNPYGDSKESSPIWIRPKSLQKANRDTFRDQFIQVVGHTQQKKVDIKGKSSGGRYYYIDTLGTSGQYMVINDDVITFPTYKNK